jgi:hypothetical protein
MRRPVIIALIAGYILAALLVAWGCMWEADRAVRWLWRHPSYIHPSLLLPAGILLFVAVRSIDFLLSHDWARAKPRSWPPGTPMPPKD